MKCRYVGGEYMHFMTANNDVMEQGRSYAQRE
jgi:hypothetical protein